MALEPFAGVLVPRAGSKVAVSEESLQIPVRRAEPLPKRADSHFVSITQSIIPHSVDYMSLAAAEVFHALPKKAVEAHADLPRRTVGQC